MITCFDEECLWDKKSDVYKDYIVDGKAGDSDIVLRLKSSTDYNPPVIFTKKYCECCRRGTFYIKKGNGITVCPKCQALRNTIVKNIKESKSFERYFELFDKFESYQFYYNMTKITDKNSLLVFSGRYNKNDACNAFFIEPKKHELFKTNETEQNSFYVYKKLNNKFLFKPLNTFILNLEIDDVPNKEWGKIFLENKKTIVKEMKECLIKLLKKDIEKDAELKGYKLIKDFINPYYNKNDESNEKM